jgi:hypothetical protein
MRWETVIAGDRVSAELNVLAILEALCVLILSYVHLR